MATGRAGDSFVLLPRILGCWGSFTRAFLPGRLISIGTRNQIIFLLKSAFESFGEKLMRVSKGRPIGASAADKVLEKFYMTNGGAA